MNTYVTGTTIKQLRESRNMTQGSLAERIGVSSKTISKWETAKGLPDISLLQPLAQALGISVIELMNGEHIINKNVSANMLRSKFYVCPICGNAIHTLGNTVVSCCGITLPALEAEESDDDHTIVIEQAVNMVKGTAVVGTPKSRDSYRVIPVPPVLQKYAIALRDTKQKYVWEAGKKNSPCNPSYFRKQFKTALAQIPEVRELTPHSCRHTYVSQMQALGVDLATIQSIVGHADTDMTQHYLHVQKSIQQTAVNRYSELLTVE